MRSTFSTPYSEEFARRCIMHCFPELDWSLELNEFDPPDLIDSDNNVGVEVTTAILPDDAELDSSFAQFTGQVGEEIPERLEKKIERNGGKLIYGNDEGRKVLKGCLHPVRALDYSNVINAIVKKTEKLNKENYTNVAVDALYVSDSESFLWDKSVPDILDAVEQRTRGRLKKFSLIFIFCSHHFYMIDTETKKIRSKAVTDEEIRMMQREALYALGRSKEYEAKSSFLIEKDT